MHTIHWSPCIHFLFLLLSRCVRSLSLVTIVTFHLTWIMHLTEPRAHHSALVPSSSDDIQPYQVTGERSASLTSAASSAASSSGHASRATVPLFNPMYLPPGKNRTITKYQKQPFLLSNNASSGVTGPSKVCSLHCSHDNLHHCNIESTLHPVSRRPSHAVSHQPYVRSSVDVTPEIKSHSTAGDVEQLVTHRHSLASSFSTSSSLSSSVSSSSSPASSNLICTIGSIIYALSLVIVSSFLYLLDLTKKTNGLHQIFK